MTNENPYEPALPAPADADQPQLKSVSPERAAYNVVSDTVTGVNLRKSDNLLQAIFILVTVVLLAAVGAVLAAVFGRGELPWYGGALAGALAGLIVGVLASGTCLMIYRAVRHMKGRHD